MRTEVNEKKVPLKNHLEELRVRIIFVVVVFILSLVIGFLITQPMFFFFKEKYFSFLTVEWNVFKPTDVFSIYVKFSVLFSLLISIPFALIQFLLFLRKGLYRNELIRVFGYGICSFTLILISLFLALYFLIPRAFSFINYLNSSLGLTQTYGVDQFFTFLFMLLICFLLVFQYPIILYAISEFGLVSPDLLKSSRKHVYFIMFIIAAVITPPDIITNLSVWFVLFILYEIGILVSNIGYKLFQKRMREEISKKIVYE